MQVDQSASAPHVLISDFSILVGITYGEWSVGCAEVRLDLKAHHLNRLGIAHGGIVLTLLDVVCGMSGIYSPDATTRLQCVTVSLTTNFIGACRTPVIHGKASVTRARKSLFYAAGELNADDGTLLATAMGVYKYLSPSGSATAALKANK